MARLDRYSTVKEVAQTGAAIGRQFSYALVAAASPLPASEVAQVWANWSIRTDLLPGTPPTRSTRSSTRWYRTPPTARCCAASACNYTPASPARWKPSSRNSSSEPERAARRQRSRISGPRGGVLVKGGRPRHPELCRDEAIETLNLGLCRYRHRSGRASGSPASRFHQSPGADHLSAGSFQGQSSNSRTRRGALSPRWPTRR